jgi:hypothetical protein
MRARGWRIVAVWLSCAERNGSTAAHHAWLISCLFHGRLHRRLHVCLIRVFELNQAIDQRHLAQSSAQAGRLSEQRHRASRACMQPRLVGFAANKPAFVKPTVLNDTLAKAAARL